MFQFKSIKELLHYFKEEKTCIDFLEERRWHGQPVCPYCGNTKVYRTCDYKRFKCGDKKNCNKKFSVLVGSIFEGTKLPLSTWFAAIYLCLNHKKGISSLQLHRDLGITQKTAWFLLHRIREMVKPQTEIELADEVQVDETYVRGKAKNRHSKDRKLIAEGKKEVPTGVVLGMVNENKTVMKVVPNAELDTLKQVIITHIKDPEALIITDASPSYNSIELHYKCRIIINHSIGEYKVDRYTTNTAEGAFAWFKRTIYGTYHFVSIKHLQRYCSTFAFRYNTRKISECSRFYMSFDVINNRLKYKKLIAKQVS